MLNKSFKNKYKKYCFTINNTFHIIYFLSIIKKYKLKNCLFIINNTNNFFIKWWYDLIFKKNKWNHIVLNWEDNFRRFPLSIIDIINYKFYTINALKHISWYELIISWDSTISNNIIVKYLSINNKLLLLVDTTAYSIIPDNNKQIKYLLYKNYLKILWIHRWIKSWKKFNYKYKLFSNNIDKSIIRKNTNDLSNIFKEKLKSLNNIKTYKNIIFLSQNIIDEYKIDKNIFIWKMEEIKKIYDKKWYKFYIKPHPLENTLYYENNFNIIDKYIPSELLDLYFWDKDTIYITYFSTVINHIQFWKKYLIWDIWFSKNEKQIIKMLNEDLNIKYLKYE